MGNFWIFAAGFVSAYVVSIVFGVLFCLWLQGRGRLYEDERQYLELEPVVAVVLVRDRPRIRRRVKVAAVAIGAAIAGVVLLRRSAR